MRIAIERRLQSWLKEQVARGRFDSLREAVNELVRAQFMQEQLTPHDVAELREEIAIGLRDLERGRAAPWDPEEIWLEVEQRNRKRARKAG